MSRKRELLCRWSVDGSRCPVKMSKKDVEVLEISDDELEPQPMLARVKYLVKNLDTLPAPSFQVVCRFLVDGGHFQSLINLRKVNRRCMTSVDTFFKQKKNAPKIDSITVREAMKVGHFNLEFRLRKDTLVLRPFFREFMHRFRRPVRRGEIVKINIPIGNRDEMMFKCFNKAVGKVSLVSFSNLKDTATLRFLNRTLLDKTKIKSMEINLREGVEFNNEFSAELLSTVDAHSIHTLNIYHHSSTENCKLTNPMAFIERMTKKLKRFFIECSCSRPYPRVFHLPDSKWHRLVLKLNRVDVWTGFDNYQKGRHNEIFCSQFIWDNDVQVLDDDDDDIVTERRLPLVWFSNDVVVHE